MQSESIIEKGVVISSGNGHAEIALIQTGACEECSAKIFCKPSEKADKKIIEADDPFGVKVGDEVQIEIAGEEILKASFTLYGIPLLLILVGIIIGMSIFSNTALPELFAFLFSIGITAFYFSIILLINKVKNNKPKLPQITFVKRL